MSEFVRVRLPSGAEVTVSAAYADGLGDSVEVLDAPATNGRGIPLPASRTNGRPRKPRTTVENEVAKKAPREKAASSPAEDTDGVAVVTMPEEAIK